MQRKATKSMALSVRIAPTASAGAHFCCRARSGRSQQKIGKLKQTAKRT